MSFIYSRRARRDKQIAGNVVYLFVVSSPRQATRQKCRLSIRGELAATSKPPKKPFIYSRRVRRDRQIARKSVYLFAVSSPSQTKRRKRRVSVDGELT